MRRFPHLATLIYVTGGTTNTIGVYAPTTASKVIKCRVETNSARTFVVSGNERIAYQLNVYYPASETVPDDATLTFSGTEYKVYPEPQVYQKHRVLRCGR